MKRYLTVFAGLLLLTFIIITVAPWGLPSERDLTPVYQSGSDVLCVDNRVDRDFVYSLHGGRITDVISIPSAEGSSVVTLLSACRDGDRVYLLAADASENIWSILASTHGGKAARVSGFTSSKGDTFMDFSFSGGKGAITLLSPDGSIKVYTCTSPESGDWKGSLIYSAPGGGSIQQAKYSDGKLYLLLSDGHAVSVGSGGNATTSDPGMFTKADFSDFSISFSVRLACKAALYLTVLISLLLVFIPLCAAKYIGQKTEHFSVRLSAYVIAAFTAMSGLMCVYFTLFAASRISAAAVGTLIIRLLILFVLTIAVSSVLFTRLIKREMNPLDGIRTQMARVSDGDYTVPEVPDRKDEIGAMLREMQEMCLNLSIRDYEVNSTTLSYHRFVPDGLEELLDRASVMEVCLGDSKAVSGCTGLFSVSNRDEARALLSDDDYVLFVNRSSALMDSAIRTNSGLLLSSGYDMSGNKVYFRDEGTGGVKAGLDLLGAAAVSSGSETQPEFFILLHKTIFLYGIAGSKDNLFPYISSSELEFLGGYSDRFKALGVRAVMTESYLNQLGTNYSTRYIGFVSSEDCRLSFKLYELLDPYTDLERNLRISYDQRLQEAITLFYRSDYYLARNMFSNILRVCPTDGIARWYLFACEHFFHSSDGEEPNFQLFGIDLE